jgi:hypothetical protein
VPSDGAYTQVAVGNNTTSEPRAHVCAIRADDGLVTCWGSDDLGQVSGVPAGVAFSQIAAGDVSTCGIRADDGHVMCWGALTAPAVPEGAFRQLASGSFAYCGVRADTGDTACWNGDDYGNRPPPGVSFAQISLGVLSGCGVRADDGTAHCWGGLEFDVPAGVRFEHVVVGGDWNAPNGPEEDSTFEHACGLRAEDGKVQCWGDDRAGQVSGAPNLTPFQQVVTDFYTVNSRGRIHTKTCGLRTDGRAVCWGDRAGLPQDVRFRRITPWGCGIRADNGRAECLGDFTPPDLSFLEIADSGGTVCGIREDNRELACWGRDTAGLVSGAPSGEAYEQLSLGPLHGCAIRSSDQRAVCWGAASGGAVTDAPPDTRFRQVTTSSDDSLFQTRGQSCAIRSDNGHVECWGYSAYGRPPSGIAFSQLADRQDCGILAENHEVFCQTMGFEGTGIVDHRPAGAFREVASNNIHACAIREADNLLTCWGQIIWNPL